MKKHLIVILIILSIASAVLAGCGSEGEDTRQYVDTIGVVFTNNADDIINELYVFPIAIVGTNILEQDMGPDLIKNTSSTRRIGSFGVTIELQNTSYNVMARGRQQDIFVFAGVPLTNVCEAVLSFNREVDANPTLTIHHRSGDTNVIVGEHIHPGDAPNHTHMPMSRTETVRFNIRNSTEGSIYFISMREADQPRRGEVELFVGNLSPNALTSVTYRLPEEDMEVTEWLLHIQAPDGTSMTFNEPFNPWETEQIEILMDGDEIVYIVS